MYRTDDVWCRNAGLVPKQVNFLNLFVFLEEGDEWAFDVRVDGGVPVEDDVAEEHGYDNGGMLRMLVAVCPNLQHLDLTCACKPSFTLVNVCRFLPLFSTHS